MSNTGYNEAINMKTISIKKKDYLHHLWHSKYGAIIHTKTSTVKHDQYNYKGTER